MTIDNVTLITMTTIFLSALAIITRSCFISKCVSVNVCYGLLDIKRDADIELEECKINTHILDTNTNNSNNV